jgi:hypothetical protein
VKLVVAAMAAFTILRMMEVCLRENANEALKPQITASMARLSPLLN